MNENPHWLAVSTSFLDRPAPHRALPRHRAYKRFTAAGPAAPHITIMSLSQLIKKLVLNTYLTIVIKNDLKLISKAVLQIFVINNKYSNLHLLSSSMKATGLTYCVFWFLLSHFPGPRKDLSTCSCLIKVIRDMLQWPSRQIINTWTRNKSFNPWYVLKVMDGRLL